MIANLQELALSRWGLRFNAAATEAHYKRWRVPNAAPSTRVAIVAGLIAWAAVLISIYFGIREHFELAARWLLLLVVPLHLIGLVATYRATRWVMPVGAIVNGVAGFTGVGLALGVADSLGGAVAAATLATYFGLAVFRITPPYALAAVLPYVSYTLYVVTEAFNAGDIHRAEFTGFVIVPITAVVSGAYVCFEIERTAREAFRNERIIERQQQALDEERANLSKFLSPEVTRMVKERGIEGTLIQHSLPITVVCSDLRGFTAYTERFGAGLMATVLREYYDTVVTVAKNYGGTVKDFAGDGALILVGAPISRPDHAEAGLALARDLAGACGQLVSRYSTAEAPLGVGLGVATGMCAVGAIGSQNRFEYTAVGHAVNLAARLCAAAGHGQILVCPATAAAAPQSSASKRRMRFKGFDEEVTVTIEERVYPR